MRALLAAKLDPPNAAFYERVRRNLAHNLLQQGCNTEALTLLREVETMQLELFKGKQNPDVAVTCIFTGIALLRQGDASGANCMLASARDAMQATRVRGISARCWQKWPHKFRQRVKVETLS